MQLSPFSSFTDAMLTVFCLGARSLTPQSDTLFAPLPLTFTVNLDTSTLDNDMPLAVRARLAASPLNASVFSTSSYGLERSSLHTSVEKPILQSRTVRDPATLSRAQDSPSSRWLGSYRLASPLAYLSFPSPPGLTGLLGISRPLGCLSASI